MTCTVGVVPYDVCCGAHGLSCAAVMWPGCKVGLPLTGTWHRNGCNGARWLDCRASCCQERASTWLGVYCARRALHLYGSHRSRGTAVVCRTCCLPVPEGHRMTSDAAACSASSASAAGSCDASLRASCIPDIIMPVIPECKDGCGRVARGAVAPCQRCGGLCRPHL